MVKAHPTANGVQRVLQLLLAGSLGIGRIDSEKGGLQGLHGFQARAALYALGDFYAVPRRLVVTVKIQRRQRIALHIIIKQLI